MNIFGGKLHIAILAVLSMLVMSCNLLDISLPMDDSNATSKMIVTPKGVVTVKVYGDPDTKRIQGVRFVLEGDFDIKSDSILYMFNHCTKSHVLKIRAVQNIIPSRKCPNRSKTILVTVRYADCDKSCGGYNIYEKYLWKKNMFYILPSSIIEYDGKPVLTDTIKVEYFVHTNVIGKGGKKGGKK